MKNNPFKNKFLAIIFALFSITLTNLTPMLYNEEDMESGAINKLRRQCKAQEGSDSIKIKLRNQNINNSLFIKILEEIDELEISNKVTSLDLSGNRITKIPTEKIEKLSNLEELNLMKNPICRNRNLTIEILKLMEKLTNLKKLSFGH